MMKAKYLILLIGGMLLSFSSHAQKVKNVSASVQEPMTDAHCVGMFKMDLIRKAKIQAIAEEFGTIVQTGSDMTVSNLTENGETQSGTSFTSLSSSQVKGEWIKSSKEELEWIISEEGGKQVLYLKATVAGKAREIESTEVDFKTSTFSCENTSCETTQFKDMESLFVNFQSPKKGYLTVFMREQGHVYRLFPYSTARGDLADAMPIEADKDYMLFSANRASDFEGLSSRQVDELQLTTMGQPRLFNRIYVIYSPKPFNKPILKTGEGGIKMMEPEDFQTWLQKNKATNKDFQDKIIYISVEK